MQRKGKWRALKNSQSGLSHFWAYVPGFRNLKTLCGLQRHEDHLFRRAGDPRYNGLLASMKCKTCMRMKGENDGGGK